MDQMTEAIIKDLRADGVYTLTLNRPHKRNAVNFEMIGLFRDALAEAANDENVKLVLIRGAGDTAFCSGGDLGEFHALQTAEQAMTMLGEMGDVLYRLATLPKPTIAYLNGAAVGGGCEIAAACDIRIASKQAKLGFIQANQAITTGWGGGSLLLEKLSPADAMAMLMSGSLYSAEEAMQAGFIMEIVKVGDVYSYLCRFADKEAGVLSAYKRILIEKWKAANLRGRMKEEIHRCSLLWESEQHHRAVEAFRNRIKQK
ncbi:MAG: enoyl-CoA hydratase/isomerase family protein [Bacillus sp. (in: firmicutes)]